MFGQLFVEVSPSVHPIDRIRARNVAAWTAAEELPCTPRRAGAGRQTSDPAWCGFTLRKARARSLLVISDLR